MLFVSTGHKTGVPTFQTGYRLVVIGACLYLYFVKLSPIDNRWKCGVFDRRRKLRDEVCRFLSLIFGAGGGIFSFLKEISQYFS
jgi:hypothetical protein